MGDIMDMFGSKSFKALESSMNAQWLQAQVSLQNLANLETPNYKAKSVVFEDVYQNELEAAGKYSFRARVMTDNSTLVRTDGNNVDSDAESVKLYKTYVQSTAIGQKITGYLTGIQYVLENGPR